MAGVRVIGREVERSRVERFLDGARPGLLLIEGPAGIGKSTLWSHALAIAAERGDRVLAWRASPAERGVAFAVLTALLDGPEAVDPPVLARLAAPRRAALAVALGRTEPGPRSPEPGLLGLAVADVLRWLAAAGPLVLALDDVQWCDRASEEALAFAVRRLRAEPVAVVLARRTPDAGTGTASALVPAGEPERIEVGPLSVAALGTLVHQRLGIRHPRPLLVRVHEASGGNPFVALEISRSLAVRGVQPAPGEPFPVPPEAGPLVRDHLAALGPPARQAVLLVAVSADPTLGLLERVMGEGAGAAVDQACEVGALVADGPRLRPSHPLFASTAYADAPPGERRALRRALADAATDPVERAVHLAATVEHPDAATSDTLASAGRLAAARGAPAVAADLLRRAADLAGDPHARPTLLAAAAEAAVVAGDPEAATTDLRAVLNLPAAGAVHARALLALGEIEYVERPNEALPLLRAALAHTGGDPLLEAEVHLHVAGMADMDPVATAEAIRRAAEILERPGSGADPTHVGCALLERALHDLLGGDLPDLADVERGLRLTSEAAHDASAAASFVARRAREVAERCLWHLGRLAEARAFDEAEHRRLTDTGQVGLLPPVTQALSMLTLLTGDWAAARRYARDCVDLVEQGEEAWRDRARLALGRIHAFDGDLAAAREIATAALARQDAAGDRWEGAIFCALLGFVELSVPDAPAALGHLTRALDHADAIGVALPTQFRFLGDLVEAAVLAGDLPLAESVLSERLVKAAERQPLPWTVAMAHRGRGLVATARGDLDPAIAAFDATVGVYDTVLPMPFERARTLYLRGIAERRAGRRRAGRRDLDEARDAFTALGARAWAARAATELGRIGGRPPGSTALTPAELSVARLAAAGHSNREIAARLVVSPRTVESQLSAAYRKLSVVSRGQLAGALANIRDFTDEAPRPRS